MAYSDSIRTASALTGIARATFEATFNQFPFASYFPLTARDIRQFQLAQTVAAAPAQASKLTGRGTTAPRGDEQAGGQVVSGQTARTSEQKLVDELNLISSPTAEQLGAWFESNARLLGQKFANLLIMMIGELLDSGEIDLSESGYKQVVDFNRPAANAVTLTGTDLWSDDGSDPIGDLRTWRDITGGSDTLYLAQSVLTGLTHNVDIIKRVLRRGTDLITEVSEEEVRSVLYADGFFLKVLSNVQNAIHSYDGATSYVIPTNTVFLLPSQNVDLVTGSAVGESHIAPTLEAEQPKYGIGASETSGVFVAAFDEDDPTGYAIRGAAEFLPLLRAPGSILKAVVTA